MNSGPTGRPYRDLSDEGRPFGALGRVADRKPRALLLADIGLARWAEEPNCRGNGSVSFGAEAPHSRDCRACRSDMLIAGNSIANQELHKTA